MKKNLAKYLILILVISGCAFDTPVEPPEDDAYIPSAPSPADGATEQETILTLSWEAEEPALFDVYFGTDSSPDSLLVADTSSTSVVVSGLTENTTYYWMVTGKYGSGRVEEGPEWSFTTGNGNVTTPGYRMTKHSVETELPSFVNVLFQVQDLQNNGIDDLTREDFLIYENDQQVSLLESALTIKKKEETEYSLRTVLMLDNSASLTNDIEEVKSAAIDFINAMTDKQQVAVFKFSERADEVLDFTSDKSALIAAVNSIQLGFSTTNLYGAVIEAANKWENSFTVNEIVQGAIVLFTDGSDTQGAFSLDDALAALGTKTCYTIGLGPDIDPVVLNVLGNAGFYSVSDVSLVSEQFITIQSRLKKYANSFYLLQYLSPKRGNNNHTLKLYIKDNYYSGVESYITGQFNSTGFYSVSSGLFLNSTPAQPEGVTDLSLNQGETVTVNASSYMVENNPSYSWQSGNPQIAAVAVDPDDNSKCYITATGSSGQETTIVVIDFENNLSKLLTVIID